MTQDSVCNLQDKTKRRHVRRFFYCLSLRIPDPTMGKFFRRHHCNIGQGNCCHNCYRQVIAAPGALIAAWIGFMPLLHFGALLRAPGIHYNTCPRFHLIATAPCAAHPNALPGNFPATASGSSRLPKLSWMLPAASKSAPGKLNSTSC